MRLKSGSGREALASPCWVTRWGKSSTAVICESTALLIYFYAHTKKPAQWRATDSAGKDRYKKPGAGPGSVVGCLYSVQPSDTGSVFHLLDVCDFISGAVEVVDKI